MNETDTMETSGTDAAVTYLGKDEDEEEEGYYELEHLPPLLEDEVRLIGSYLRKVIIHNSCLLRTHQIQSYVANGNIDVHIQKIRFQ